MLQTEIQRVSQISVHVYALFQSVAIGTMPDGGADDDADDDDDDDDKRFDMAVWGSNTPIGVGHFRPSSDILGLYLAASDGE